MEDMMSFGASAAAQFGGEAVQTAAAAVADAYNSEATAMDQFLGETSRHQFPRAFFVDCSSPSKPWRLVIQLVGSIFD
jgi:hypothetical protein